MKKYFFIVLAFLAMQSCSNDPVNENGNKSLVLNEKVEVKVGECASNEYVTVCLDSVTSDSRCPINAECIWEGNASVALSVKVNNETHNITLGTNGQFNNDTIIGDYQIKLNQLTPYPELPNEILQGDYVAELVIGKD